MRYRLMEGLPIAAVHDLELAANGSAAAKKFLEDSEPWYAAVKKSEPTPSQIETLDPWHRGDPGEEFGLSPVVPLPVEWTHKAGSLQNISIPRRAHRRFREALRTRMAAASSTPSLLQEPHRLPDHWALGDFKLEI